MQKLKTICFFVLIVTASACSQPAETLPTKLTLHSKNECELIFKFDDASVVENFCNIRQKPILIQLEDQKIEMTWIDEKTSRFLFQEGCAEQSKCFYELRKTRYGLSGRFFYLINLTEGEYSFEVDTHGAIKLISSSSKDLPS